MWSETWWPCWFSASFRTKWVVSELRFLHWRWRARAHCCSCSPLAAWLFAGRLLIGLAVGVASGTGTAWLADQLRTSRRSTASLTAATANLAGIALGPLAGGLLARYAPAPLRLPFAVYIVALVAVAVGVGRTTETPREHLKRLGDVRMHLRVGVPRELIGSFAAPAITGFVIFALGGLYFALIPSILVRDLHQTNVALGDLVVFELGTVATGSILLSRRARPATSMRDGLLLLVPAVALVVAAQATASMLLLLVAAALAGAAIAPGYAGSLQVVNEIAPNERRAEVLSAYFLACFVGNSVPVIGLGVLTTVADPLVASIAFAGTVAGLGVAALAWQARTTRPSTG